LCWQNIDKDVDELMVGGERLRLGMPRIATSTRGRQSVGVVQHLMLLLLFMHIHHLYSSLLVFVA